MFFVVVGYKSDSSALRLSESTHTRIEALPRQLVQQRGELAQILLLALDEVRGAHVRIVRLFQLWRSGVDRGWMTKEQKKREREKNEDEENE